LRFFTKQVNPKSSGSGSINGNQESFTRVESNLGFSLGKAFLVYLESLQVLIRKYVNQFGQYQLDNSSLDSLQNKQIMAGKKEA